MKEILTAFLIIISYTLVCKAQLPPNNASYELVFNEEFDGTAIDETKWKHSPPWNQKGYIDTYWCHGNPAFISNNLYGYRKRNFDNCILNQSGTGSVTIVSKKEVYKGDVWNWPLCTDDSCNFGTGFGDCNYTRNPPICWDHDDWWFNYTTNRLISKDEFKYGYFEIRCKIPVPVYPKTNQGVGPNFWLYGAKGEVSWSEIDVFEFNGSNNKFGSSIHYEDKLGDTIHGIPNNTTLIQVNDGQFHKYAVFWEPHMLSFYYDDQLIVSTPLFANSLVEMPMIIDVNFPLHTMCQLVDPIRTQLPHYYEIDYVKVYQLKYNCNGDYVICNNTNTSVINCADVTIGGVGCNPILTSGQVLNITSNSLIFQSNFTIDGGQFNYTYKPCYQSIHNVNTNKSVDYPEPAPESYYKRLNSIYHEY